MSFFMRKNLRNILMAGAFGLAGLLPMQRSEAQGNVSGNVEYIQSEKSEASLVRPNLFYKVLGLNGYTFVESYRDENFFGKTILSKDLGSRVKPTVEFVYGSGFRDKSGAGASFNVPMPKSTSLSVKVLPLWIDDKGYIKNRVAAGFSGNVSFPLGFSLSSFGEANIASKGGAQWGYGEVRLGKDLSKNLSVAFNPLLKNKGKLAPRIENAFSAKYTFK